MAERPRTIAESCIAAKRRRAHPGERPTAAKDAALAATVRLLDERSDAILEATPRLADEPPRASRGGCAIG